MNDVLAIIFAGGLSWEDHAGSPLARGDQLVIGALLKHLKKEGITQVSLCVSESMEIEIPDGMSVRRLDDQGIAGTLGCVYREVIHWDCSQIVILNARMLCPPRFDELLACHTQSMASVTLFRDPFALDFDRRISPIYVCDRELFERIPEVAYSDLKEGLLAMLKGEANVVHLKKPTGRYSTLQQYQIAMLHSIKTLAVQERAVQGETVGCWQSPGSDMSPSSRCFGKVLQQQGSIVRDGAAIIGPAIVGRDATVASEAVVCRSVLQDGTCVDSGEFVCDDLVDSKRRGEVEKPMREIRTQRACDQRLWRMSGVAFLLAMFLWATASQWDSLWVRLSHSDEYSSGLLVPFLTGYILWCRRERLQGFVFEGSWGGALVLLLGQVMRIAGMYYASTGLKDLSLMVSITGLTWLIVGTRLFARLLTSVLFLGLMLPWPNRIQSMIALPLQEYATKSAVFCLQVLGYDVLREGMLISIGDTTVAVAEACNGLRMITAFLVISSLVAMLVRRPLWQKMVLCVSSLPIALICNTVRLTVTSIAFTMIGGDNSEYWEKVFHDFGGYAMMPLALALVVLELWLLEKLTSPPETKERVVIKRN